MSDRAKERGVSRAARSRGFLLPSVDKVLRSETGILIAARYGHLTAARSIRGTLAQLRDCAIGSPGPAPDVAAIALAALRLAEDEDTPAIKRVFNLTGTVLHTNLGRAVLPDAAIAAAVEAMKYPVALEFDLTTGARGERDRPVRDLICELCGAEDACVVNNNAAAVLLALNSLAAGKGTLISRGELIEIGGSFRLPDIMTRAGTRLIEVGTTNRTHLADYENAIDEDTALILKAHTSNFLIQGFTKTVPAGELAPLARAKSIPFVHDLGSGALIDLARYGLKAEPTAASALSAGAGLVTFSGDKLLGGPQAGIVAGKRDLIEKIVRNPMKRALRAGKITLAALEATLKLYRNPDRLPHTLPALRAFLQQKQEISAAATRLADPLSAAIGDGFRVRTIDCASEIGSGSLPLETLPSAGLAIEPTEKKRAGSQLQALSAAFRGLPIPVIGRIRDNALIFDLRSLDDEAAFLAQLGKLKARAAESR
jgi:L-seryl-tRNA(Ser) seleniumtransferase